MTDNPGTPTSSMGRPMLPGVLLIGFGLFFLVSNLAGIEFHHLWPIFLLGPSLAFYFQAFRDRSKYGLLMPATVLFMASAVFITCELLGWDSMQHLWPVFILAPGIGFFLLYWFGRRERGLLVPGAVLTGIGLVFLMVQGGFGQFWPLVLVVAGIIVLTTQRSTEG